MPRALKNGHKKVIELVEKHKFIHLISTQLSAEEFVDNVELAELDYFIRLCDSVEHALK